MSTYQIKPAGVTDIGNVRPTNEDYLLADGDLFVVADGMGGQGHGEVASRVAVEALKEAFAADQTTSGLVEAVGQANRAVRERAEQEPERRGMGTTIAAVALVADDDEGRLVVVNVGDSRVYLLHEEQLTRLSRDHSRVGELVRSGAITEEQATTHPERHILTHALGIEPEIEPYVAHAEPHPGDRVLVCSDGLFNELRNEEIVDILNTVGQPNEAVERLVALAKDHGGNDNITAIVLDIEGSPSESKPQSGSRPR